MANIAILSTAHIHTKGFIDNIIKSSDGRRVAGIWDDVVNRGQRYAEMASAPFVANLDQLLQDESVDGFVICAENTRHLPLLERVLPLGKPVFCEKPLVTRNPDLVRIRTLLAAHPETVVFCGYFMPFLPQYLAVEEALRQKMIGKVTRIRMRNAHHAAYGHWFDNPDVHWFTQPELSGGGAFMDMGTHAIHLVRRLFGPVREVWAEIDNHTGIYPMVDDYGVAHLHFANGIWGTVEAAWTQPGGFNGLEVSGETGTIWISKQGVVLSTPGANDVPLELGEELPSRVNRLVSIIRGKIEASEVQSDLAATLDTVAIMDAAYRSAKEGSWVNLDH